MDILKRFAQIVEQKAIDVRQNDDDYEFRCEVQPTTADIENQSRFEIEWNPPVQDEKGLSYSGQLIYTTKGVSEKWRQDQVFYMGKFAEIFSNVINIPILATAYYGKALKDAEEANPGYDSFADEGGSGVYVELQRNIAADDKGREVETIEDVETLGSFYFRMVWDFDLFMTNNTNNNNLLNS